MDQLRCAADVETVVVTSHKSQVLAMTATTTLPAPSPTTSSCTAGCRLQAGAEPNKDKLQTASYKAKIE